MKPTGIQATVNHLFRTEYGKMVAVLVKIFGTHNYEMAEDVVHDALLSAMQSWKYRGIPEQPKAWLYKVAKNRALDILRREKHKENLDFTDPERVPLTSEYTLTATIEEFWQEHNITDDFLGMVFACCHPSISEENQKTFILKSLCGLSTKEISRAFLTEENTISKRLYRTKAFFRSHQIRPQIPPPDQIKPRTHIVLAALYLLFNEGYSSTHSEDHIREELIGNALYLCQSLLSHPSTALPETYAFMALICFHASRSTARLSKQGFIIPLEDQNRSLWDEDLIAEGITFMQKSAFGDVVSTYHLEAAIAYEHCTAKNHHSTNWAKILQHYDALLNTTKDPVVALNRCVAIMELRGPETALSSIKLLEHNQTLDKYYLYHAILGEVHTRLGNVHEARVALEKSGQLTLSLHEKRFLMDKIGLIDKDQTNTASDKTQD